MTMSEFNQKMAHMKLEALSMMKDHPIPVRTGNMRDNGVVAIDLPNGGFIIGLDLKKVHYAKYTIRERSNPRNYLWYTVAQARVKIQLRSLLRSSTKKMVI